MVVEWMSPLVTSALRLVVITLLFAANCGAVCRTFMLPKYRGVLSYKWITILTILILNLIYLSIIWAPFTITTFKYNLQDLPKSDDGVVQLQLPSTYILEYLDRRNGSLVQETKLGRLLGETTSGHLILPEGDGPQDLITVGFNQLRKFQDDFAPSQPTRSSFGDSLDHWITHVQDVVTSCFTYSLILTAVMRKIMLEKGVMVRRLQASISSLLLALIPIPLTVATRRLANTTHQFALHTSEISKSGYTMYSIICDVNISQDYVVGLFLECTVVLLLAAILLVVTQKRMKRSLTRPQDEDNCDLVQVEEVACKFVLALGAGWAWPVKPVLVTVLFCIHGTHWSNVVCWLANMVVAIPVVFMPLAVFLSRPEESDSCNGYDIFTNDSENTTVATEKYDADQCTEMEVENEAKEGISCKLTVNAADMSPVGKVAVSSDILGDVPEKGNQARENLKFYLGSDIFGNKKEDEVCILSKSCLTSDDNESAV